MATKTPDRFELEQEMDAPLTKERRRPKDPRPRGHAALPGTGPAGETCKTCAHLDYRQMSKTYYKCGLMKAYWTGSRGSDIRVKDPACKRWQTKSQDQD